MKYDPKTHHRKSVRLRGYDYAGPGQYFVTVCTHHRELLFGEVIAGQMQRNGVGDIVHAEWYVTQRVRPGIRLDAFIVMPNHLHGIMEIVDVGARRRLAPTTSSGPRLETTTVLVSCPTLLLTKSSLERTPSPDPPRLERAPAALHPLLQGGEGHRKQLCGTGH